MEAAAVLKKLRLKSDAKILIINAPEVYTKMLKGVTYDTTAAPKLKGTYDFVQIFATKQSELEKLAKANKKSGKNDCIFWACYPKGTGDIPSDIKRESVWVALGLAGLHPVSQVAIDNTWSALRGRPD